MPYLTTTEDKKRYWSEYGQGSADVLTGAGRVFAGDVGGGGAQVFAGVKKIHDVLEWSKPSETASNDNPNSAFQQGKAVKYFRPGQWDKFYAEWFGDEHWTRQRAVPALTLAFRQVGLALAPESAAKIAAVILADPSRRFGKAAANPIGAAFLAVLALWIGSPESTVPVEVVDNADTTKTKPMVFHDEKAFDYLQSLAELGTSALAASTALAVGFAAPLVPGGETVLALLGDVGPEVPTPSPESGKVTVKRLWPHHAANRVHWIAPVRAHVRSNRAARAKKNPSPQADPCLTAGGRWLRFQTP